tara:strand:+ start:146 stop:682 length:537 start_codon:yes stop_codon:yes gene_type:complete
MICDSILYMESMQTIEKRETMKIINFDDVDYKVIKTNSTDYDNRYFLGQKVENSKALELFMGTADGDFVPMGCVWDIEGFDTAMDMADEEIFCEMENIKMETEARDTMNELSDTQKLISIHLQASAPCSMVSVIRYCDNQDPKFSEENTIRAFVNLLDRELVGVWDGAVDAFEWKESY